MLVIRCLGNVVRCYGPVIACRNDRGMFDCSTLDQQMGFASENAVTQEGGHRALIGLIDDEADLVAMSRAYLERDVFVW